MLHCFGCSVSRAGLWRGGVSLLPALALLMLLATAACESSGQADAASSGDSMQVAAAEDEEADDGPDYPYEMVLGGMLRDTLRGSTRFGIVFDPVTRREQWVVSMRSGGDVTSGVYLARPDTARPQTGTYEIVERPPVGQYDSLRARSKKSFTMIYRAGMRRAFSSQEGTVELTTSNDTLIEGTVQATLRGTASPPGEPPREGTVTLTGDFRAEKRVVGFMFGV